MTRTKIKREDLDIAAAHLHQTLHLQGARSEHTRIRERKGGLYALATVNGVDVENFLPFGMIEWATIARQMIAVADAAGGVGLVM